MVPRNAPKVILEASRFPVPKKVGAPVIRFEPFGDTWAILGAIWAPAGRQGGPKIEHFGIKTRQNIEKWGPEWGIKKSMNFWLNLGRKMWGFECAEPTQMLYI